MGDEKGIVLQHRWQDEKLSLSISFVTVKKAIIKNGHIR
jgi:hypothetical protein